MNAKRSYLLIISLFGSIFLVFVLMLVLSAQAIYARADPLPITAGITRYISPIGNDTANLCTSPTLPCQTVQHAINVAQDGDELLVSAGAYTGTMASTISEWGNYVVTATVIITKDINLLGGYSADFNVHDPDLYVTTLSAIASTQDRVIFMYGTTATVDGFTITGANCENVGIGAGIWVFGGSPNISHNKIHGNQAQSSGGGIYISDGAHATIAANQIYSNTTEREGGGITVQSSDVVISNNVIISNVTNYSGGGILLWDSTADILSNTISHNRAITPTDSYGGGIWIGNGTITVTGNTIDANTSNDSAGGISVRWGGNAIISYNHIAHNYVERRGGGIRVGNDSTATITSNYIFSNTAATNSGGGIDISNIATATVVDNYIGLNTTGGWAGGGIIVSEAGVTITANDIVSNTAMSGWGGGIRVTGNSIAAIANNVIRGNTADGAGGLEIDGYSVGTVDANTIAYNDGDPGLRMLDGANVTATNNVIASNIGQGVAIFDDPTQVRLINNMIAFNTDNGITHYTSTLLVRNNIIVGNTNGIYNPGGGISLDHNDVWNNMLNYNGVITGTTDISTDPLFLNEAQNDYHIRFGSPVIDAGASAGAPAHDRDGIMRPQGDEIDIGAYEVAEGAQTVVDPAIDGMLIYTDTQGLTTTVQIPSGAVAETTTLIYMVVNTVTAPSGFGFAGHAFDLNAYQDGVLLPGFTFLQPVTITVYYADADITGLDENSLKLYYLDNGVWKDVTQTCTPPSSYKRHPNENWFSVPVCHLSRLALFGKEFYVVHLPFVKK
jgi:parallel beta-helix repeat protein